MKKTRLRGLLSPLLKKIRLKKISKFVEEDKIILDAGCDDAALLKFIKNFKHYDGIDFNIKLIENNKKIVVMGNVDFFQKDLNEELNLERKYDIVILSAVIEHLNDFEKFVSDISKFVEENGLMIITTPVKKSDLILKIGAKLGIFSKDSLEEHQKYFSKKDFINLNGWDLEKYKKFELGLNQLIILKKK